MQGQLHHVSLITRDLDRAVTFYRDRLGFTPLKRPPLAVPGAWLSGGGVELHLILYPPGTTRASPDIDINDIHFAIRVADFDAALAELQGAGFREGGGDLGMVVRRNSPVGYGQIYVRDPDHNLIEINAPV